MTSLRFSIAVLAFAAACNETALPSSSTPAPDLARGPVADLGAPSPSPSPSPSSPCVARPKCLCTEDPACTVVAQPCWCGPEECGDGLCACGGGAYVGCAPRGCPSVLDCPLAQLPTTPDADGCFRCRPAPGSTPTCEAAKAQLAAACGFSAAYLGGLSCQSNSACVARCITDVKSCADVGCGFCTVCDCAELTSPLAECVNRCLAD
jgi:hypothetical protein